MNRELEISKTAIRHYEVEIEGLVKRISKIQLELEWAENALNDSKNNLAYFKHKVHKM